MVDMIELRSRANAGDPQAQGALAYAMLADKRGPQAVPEAVRLLRASAARGQPDAYHLLAALSVFGIGCPKRLDDAYNFVREAAALGDENARAQLEVLGRDALIKEPWVKPIHLEQLAEAPRISMVRKFLPRTVCDWLVKIAERRMQPSVVYDAKSASLVAHPIRTSESASFRSLEPDLMTLLVARRIASAVGLPIEHQEANNVLRYAVGQEYRPHFDFIRPGADAEAFEAELAAYGQRIVTVLIYLNDDYVGGETAFPLIDLRFKGKAGDALIFWSVTEAGELDRLSWHAGLPVTKGEKWLLSKWIRQRPVALF